jgi:hypothetical protein
VVLLIVALVTEVIPIGVVILVRGVKLLPLEAVGNKVSDIAAFEAAPR